MDRGASPRVHTESACVEYVSSCVHTGFILYFGGYLGHVSDASGSLCLVAVSYLDIWCFTF